MHKFNNTYTWERHRKTNSPKWLKSSLQYHIQLEKKEDIEDNGLGL